MYFEELLWILDKPGTTIHNQDEKFRENIEFVHSLDLKCDSVGWCKLDLANPKTDAIFAKISAFCKENGWRARCLYTRMYAEPDSTWYELVPADFSDDTLHNSIETATESADIIFTRHIRAFRETASGPKILWRDLFVPERFRNFCLQKQLDDLDFCWAKDTGKYEAEQYFHVYGKRLIPRVGIAGTKDPAALRKMDGRLPDIAEVFDDLQQINLPDCYPAADLPSDGIAYVCKYQSSNDIATTSLLGRHLPRNYREMERNTILIHKDTAKQLLDSRVLTARQLRPALIVDRLPIGYTLAQTQPIARPCRSFMDQMNAEYDSLRLIKRPVRSVSEKEALKLLRKAGKDRKEDFRKAFPKAKMDELLRTAYGPLTPYYLIANGGFLSDEYELLPYNRAEEENAVFHDHLKTEALLDKQPEGVVFARCADADAVLLCSDGTVIRFSHESPEIIKKWPNLPQFIADSLTEL